MKKIMIYKRWPRKKEILQKRLFKICKQIDEILRVDFPTDSFDEGKNRNLYEKKFWELFQNTGYKWDKEPIIKLDWGHICCSRTVILTFYVMGRDGEIIKC